MQPTNEELMLQVKRGDDLEALEQLVERFKGVVYSLAYSMLRSREDAEEAAQDTFLKLHRARGLYEEGRPLEPWLLRIAGNTSRDVLRRRKTSALPVAQHDDGNFLENLVADPGTLDDGRIATSRAVHHEVSQLSDRLRLPLVMKYIAGATNRQIADALGISVSNVKVRLSRAKDVLQSRLERIVEA